MLKWLSIHWGGAPLGLINPDMSTWAHPNIQLITQAGYQVAVLPPDRSQFETTPSWEQGKGYRWTFEAKADQSGDMLHSEMWGGRGTINIPLTTEWQEYSSAGYPNPAHNNFYFWNASTNGNIYLRNIKIYEA